MSFPIRLILGLALSLAIAWLAYRRGSLSASGVVGAVLTGTLTVGGGGWAWGFSLIAFFLSSTMLTRWRRERKLAVAAAFAKGGRRDLGQALANGGLGTVIAVLGALFPHPAWAAAFAGALAAANADTWATEIGVFSPAPPRLITTGRQVAAGTSGGITFWGTLAAAGGALFLGAAYYLLARAEQALLGASSAPNWTVVPLALASGLIGSLVDSLLGATLQRMYRCPRCGRQTERRQHCDEPTVPVRGLSWLSNDGVNFSATAVGALVAGGLCLLLRSIC